MPTNEERREAAAWIRNGAHDIDINGYIKLAINVVDRGDGATWGQLALKLADLIDPEPERTCNVTFRSHELSQTQTALVKSCSGCGFEFGTEIKNTFPFEVTINSISIPNYCPFCGAKVIEESEKSS